MHRGIKVAVATATVCLATAAGASAATDVRLSNDTPGGGYVSDYTLATGNAYTDQTLDECSQARGRQNEPSVAVDPRNTDVIVGSSNDYCGVFNRTTDGVPQALKPPVPATARGLFGYAVDSQTGPPSLALAQMHLGHLADSGDPRDWVDGELVTVDRGAQVFTNPLLGGTSWFHPQRLSTDGGAVNGGVRTPAQAVLGLRAWHGDQVHLPIYAYETSLGHGRVIAAAKALAKRSHVPRRMTTYVDRSAVNSHLDPLADAPATNDFLRTVLPFLRGLKR